MHSGLKICEIFGVPVYADWSWVLYLSIVTWTWAVTIFPVWYPQWNAVMAWGIAGVAALLLFAGVFVHELAHILAAKEQRIPLRDITLFPFGGIPSFPQESPSLVAEIVTAACGLATSLLMGGVSFYLGLVRAATLSPSARDLFDALRVDPLATLLLWLGATNLLLGSLNVIPALPLDGGRVFGFFLAKASGDPRRACQWAARVGQIAGWGVTVAGIALALGARLTYAAAWLSGGLCLVFLGAVLLRAAGKIDRQIALDAVLAPIPTAQCLGKRVPIVPPNIPLSRFVQDYVLGADHPAFPVVDNNHLVGVVWSRDVHKVARDDWDTTEVGEVMISANRLAVARADGIAPDALVQMAHVRELVPDGAGQPAGGRHGQAVGE